MQKYFVQVEWQIFQLTELNHNLEEFLVEIVQYLERHCDVHTTNNVGDFVCYDIVVESPNLNEAEELAKKVTRAAIRSVLNASELVMIECTAKEYE